MLNPQSWSPRPWGRVSGVVAPPTMLDAHSCRNAWIGRTQRDQPALAPLARIMHECDWHGTQGNVRGKFTSLASDRQGTCEESSQAFPRTDENARGRFSPFLAPTKNPRMFCFRPFSTEERSAHHRVCAERQEHWCVAQTRLTHNAHKLQKDFFGAARAQLAHA